ncbi:MAG: hypothetical protein WC781_01360 [Candidatus Pacearchaeota archaeon]|jgi:hypothetical protein
MGIESPAVVEQIKANLEVLIINQYNPDIFNLLKLINPRNFHARDLSPKEQPKENELEATKFRKLARYTFYELKTGPENVLGAVKKSISDRALGYRKELEELSNFYGFQIGDTSLGDWVKAKKFAASRVSSHYGTPLI